MAQVNKGNTKVKPAEIEAQFKKIFKTGRQLWRKFRKELGRVKKISSDSSKLGDILRYEKQVAKAKKMEKPIWEKLN